MASLSFGALAASLLLAGCGPEPKPAAPAAVAATPPPAPPPPTQYDAEAFFATTSYQMPAGYAWSADDKQLLVSSDETGIFNVYGLTAAGEGKQPLTASTTDSTYAVSWFPADGRALFTADSGGNEINHLYVREADGATRDLTPGDKVKAEFFGWSADKQNFFVTTNERKPEAFDLYRYAAKDYARTLVFKNEEAWQVAEVSPDDRYLALVKPRTSADADVYLLDLSVKKHAPQLVTKHEGNVTHSVYAFTHDSKQLVYATDEFGEFNQAWTYEISSGTRTPLIRADWDISFVSYSESGRFRVWGVNEDGRTAVHILDNNYGKEIALPDLPAGDLAQIRFSRDETKLALLLSSDTSPNDVYTIELKGSMKSARLTKALNPKIKEDDLVETKVVRYASFDGLKIPGILYQPHVATAKHKVPVLVWVHGGPGGQSRRGYSATIQHLVNHGYGVLAANNRGSSGYGKTFFHMDDRKHGDVDLKDIVAAKQYLIGLDWVDRERVGIIGGSYGGYMVGAALAFSPDTFDVGIDIFGVMNWVRTLTNIPPWWASFKESLYDEMGDPATDGERHRAISPLFHAKNIRAPLLVVQGANDPRVLKVESDEIVEAVRANGVAAEYKVFPDEGHGFTKRANRIDASDTFVVFLDKYLKAGAE
ncbi:MAG TPA: alpha/beta fold hydrolase [Steroidobacteraceae bacterium]|nr:alpha/beta fold hydrolase [Steroidobacteraceae bacterium]